VSPCGRHGGEDRGRSARLTIGDGREAVIDKEDLPGVFADFDPAEYEDEAKERWGATGAYQESAHRTNRYTREDWECFKARSAEVNAQIAGLMDEGVSPEDPRAMAAVECHRSLIDTWFYPCSHEMHAGLGQMCVSDPRFAATYEKIQAGMAQYVCDAIAANAAHNRPSVGEASES
jgi:MerR family transcriptional regulator, thiopeptide resistance regulator